MTLDALVLLGCRVREPLVGAPLRRVERAASAHREGMAPLVVVSGGRSWNGVVEADVLGGALIERGVPAESLVYERRSRTTHENAVRTAELLLARGAKRVGVVTCDWHLPRALYCFRRAGFEAIGIEARSPPLPLPRRVFRTLRETTAWVYVRTMARPW
ncbi:MAG TPA: YdcF family protein [Polyangiaceae bacterium]|nr:YdcF family protein [Polyangiaceae bacterium]